MQRDSFRFFSTSLSLLYNTKCIGKIHNSKPKFSHFSFSKSFSFTSSRFLSFTSGFHSTSLMPLIGSLDQGTSSTRFILFSDNGAVVDAHQVELTQIYTDGKTGWTEHDPMEIWRSTSECIETVMKRHKKEQVTAIGITNQRETTVVWDKSTGKPLHNAIVWHDSRTSEVVSEIIAQEGNSDVFRPIVGLPISTYFSAMKLHWILHKAPNLPSNLRRSLSPTLSQCIKNKTALFGTVDSWLIWCMTGGIKGGVHVTDVSNASRTLLMRLSDCNWDEEICKKLSIPMHMLPQIRSSSEVYGYMNSGPLRGVAVAGCLGDQQAALVGQLCLSPGTAKNTYGTGCFLLLNTGEKIVHSSKGLLTTVGYQLGPNSPIIYALEGSVAVAGAAVRWLRDEVHLISKVSELSTYADQVKDTGGIYFVPAFSGLLSPYYRPDARGVLIGITHSTNRGHICRAVLEAAAYQSAEILLCMESDAGEGLSLTSLRVDGGMANSDILCKFQSNLLGIDVVRPANVECTAAGAAFAAGLATGVYKDITDLKEKVEHGGGKVWQSNMTKEEREKLLKGWRKAVTRTFGWVENQDSNDKNIKSAL